MRYLVLSDVHANLPALDAVVNHARQRGFDEVAFLGDAVGYYPQAQEVVERLIQLDPKVRLMGNHDAALLEMLDGLRVTGDASVVSEVLERHAEQLTDDSVDFLRTFRAHHVDDQWEAAHGALTRPWEYLATMASAQANVALMSTRLLFVGHTHHPRVYARARSGTQELWRTVTFREERVSYRVPPLATVIANPGAVGQPRDQVPLAAYALFDVPSMTIDFHRVEFDVVAVQTAVRAAGYPEVLAARLAVGR
ncbi:MAG TPA: CRISPR-associated protein Cas5 [Trueperaceae bacterium]